MANTWPKERRIIGTKVQRVDGPEKATGRAKYSYDINRPGLLHGMILRCPHAHAKLTALETAAAENMPGVQAVHVIAKPGKELYFAGDEVAAVAADTEDHAADALHAIKATYEPLEFLVKEVDALKSDKKTVPGSDPSNVKVGSEAAEGDVDAAFKEADATHEGEYGVPVISHQCLETHGMVAEWDSDGGLTVWASTQAVPGTAAALAGYFKIPAAKAKCITHYMGGGFGSKFGPDIQGYVAGELAKKAGKPVKLMLDREAEIMAAGNRPSAYGKVKIAGTKDGTITAYQIDCYGSPGYSGGNTVNLNLLPYVYTVKNFKRKHSVVKLNAGGARAMRAPGHPQNCFLTECPLDDLAAKLGLDPLKIRLKNLPSDNRKAIYEKEIEIAIKLAEWEKKWHPPGKGPDKGPVKHGIGMGLHTWGGQGVPNNDIKVTIGSDGSVLAECSTQDLGTGERTVLPIIIAEVLGLDVKNVTVKIGESQFGRSTPSGGSTTCPGTSPAALNAGIAARDALFEKIAPRFNAKPEDLSVDPKQPGRIVDAANNKTYTWKEVCGKLGMDTVVGTGNWTAGLSGQGVGGVQIVEVKVDTETGVVRCTKVVAVQDCGLIINKLACESQVAGGVIMGVNYALFEENILDRHTGRQVNADMEFYKLGGIEDMPKIVVHMHDMPERGVIGIGEPPTISTCAAVSNAIFNAIGVRVPIAPFTPERVLDALAKGGKS